jgi:hypothetical protein
MFLAINLSLGRLVNEFRLRVEWFVTIDAIEMHRSLCGGAS